MLEEKKQESDNSLTEIKKDINNILAIMEEDKEKDIIINRLHNEVQNFRNNLIAKQSDAILMDIIHLIDRNNKIINDFKGSEMPGKDEIIIQIQGMSYDLEDILYRNNVENFVVEDEEIDIQRQTIVKTIDTNNKDLVGKKYSSVLPGYHRDGIVFRKERVCAYKKGKEDVEDE